MKNDDNRIKYDQFSKYNDCSYSESYNEKHFLKQRNKHKKNEKWNKKLLISFSIIILFFIVSIYYIIKNSNKKIISFQITNNNNYTKESNNNKIINPQMKQLVDELKSKSIITSKKVYDTMIQIDRGEFTLYSSNSYLDFPSSINYNATISAPHMHAYALEYLKDFIKEGSHVLDIGSGSGYLTVAFSKVMNDKGIVVGVEYIKELYEFGRDNILKNNSNLIKDNKIILVNGDGKLGFKKYAPYDAIHVGAAAYPIPQELINQLSNNGRMFIPVGKPNENQYINIIDKDANGNVKITKTLSVLYVPLK